MFEDSAVREIARMASDVNERTENIGARRLHTVMEKLLEVLSQPFQELPEDSAYHLPPPPSATPYQTFCGT